MKNYRFDPETEKPKENSEETTVGQDEAQESSEE